MSTEPSRSRIWLALWVVYLIWGSTYLAIRVAVHPTHGQGFHHYCWRAAASPSPAS
jgi:hypothetical protein